MKESFSELYARLYNENFAKLEEMRAKEKRSTGIIIGIVFAIFILAAFNPIFIFLAIIALIAYFAKNVKRDNYKIQKREKIGRAHV